MTSHAIIFAFAILINVPGVIWGLTRRSGLLLAIVTGSICVNTIALVQAVEGVKL